MKKTVQELVFAEVERRCKEVGVDLRGFMYNWIFDRAYTILPDVCKRNGVYYGLWFERGLSLGEPETRCLNQAYGLALLDGNQVLAHYASIIPKLVAKGIALSPLALNPFCKMDVAGCIAYMNERCN